MKVKCEVNGKKFVRFIRGRLVDAEKSIEIKRCEPIPEMIGHVAAYPAEDDCVYWVDIQGVTHQSLFFKDQPFAVSKEFIVNE